MAVSSVPQRQLRHDAVVHKVREQQLATALGAPQGGCGNAAKAVATTATNTTATDTMVTMATTANAIATEVMTTAEAVP